MLLKIEIWVKRVGVLAGLVAIFTPMLGYRRSRNRSIGKQSGIGTRYLSWPTVFSMAIAYIGVGYLGWRPLPLRIPDFLRFVTVVIGGFFYYSGIGLYLWGYKSLGDLFSPSSSYGAQLYSDHRLIQDGPYRFVRHPMYLGVLMTSIGALLLYRTWTTLLYSLSALATIFRARREDSLLAKTFGDAWDGYRRQVPGWIPRIRKT